MARLALVLVLVLTSASLAHAGKAQLHDILVRKAKQARRSERQLKQRLRTLGLPRAVRAEIGRAFDETTRRGLALTDGDSRRSWPGRRFVVDYAGKDKVDADVTHEHRFELDVQPGGANLQLTITRWTRRGTDVTFATEDKIQYRRKDGTLIRQASRRGGPAEVDAGIDGR